MFFRGREGIRRLWGMLGLGPTSANVRELSPLLEYTASLRNRMREIRNEKPILGENQGLEIEEKLVQSELARLEKVLEMELQEKRRLLP